MRIGIALLQNNSRKVTDLSQRNKIIVAATLLTISSIYRASGRGNSQRETAALCNHWAFDLLCGVLVGIAEAVADAPPAAVGWHKRALIPAQALQWPDESDRQLWAAQQPYCYWDLR